MTNDESKSGELDLGDFFERFSSFLEKEKERHNYKFPIEISGIDWKVEIGIKSKSLFSRGECRPGAFVAIRSLKEGHGDKTYLGLLIGYVPIHVDAAYDKTSKRMEIIVSGDNPAIFVFDLNEVVLGAESWWGPIKDEAHLRQITKDDIENVWYVKALKALGNGKGQS